MGRVFQAEGTAYVKLRSESNYFTLRKRGDVQRLEGKLQRGHKPDATTLDAMLRGLGFVQWATRSHGKSLVTGQGGERLEAGRLVERLE